MSRRKYVPRAFAPMVSDFLASNPRVSIFGKPGVGKTIFTLTHLDLAYRVWGDIEPTLVVAPLRVARDTWATEASKWEHLDGLEVVPIVGTPEQRKAAMRRDAPIYVTNYENIPWLVDAFKNAGRPWPFRRVIADEAHKLKGFRLRQGTQRAQALAKFAHKDVKEWVNLTGTPASNGLEDLWALAWFLDGGQRLGRTFSAFRDRWFYPARTGQFHQWRATEHAQEEIQQRLADICLTLDPRDWFDLKEPIVNVISVDMPASARSKYKDMERELFTLIDGHEVEAFSAAAKSQKCLQMANGAAYLDAERHGAGKWVGVHDAKLEALQELVDATGDEPLLVVYEFVSDRERILNAFSGALDLAKDDDLKQAKAGKGKVWIGHPQSIGEGVDGLQEWCSTIVFFAQSWRLDLHDQVIERVGPMRQMQAGKDRAVFIHYLVAKGTIDELVMMRRDGKRSVQDILLEHLKGKQ